MRILWCFAVLACLLVTSARGSDSIPLVSGEANHKDKGNGESLKIQCHVLEVNVRELKKAMVAVPPESQEVNECLQGLLDHSHKQDSDGLQTPQREVATEAAKWMQANHVAKKIAAPTVQAPIGKAAFFHVGSTVPIAKASSEGVVYHVAMNIGTMVQIQSEKFDSGTIRLSVNAQQIELDDTLSKEVQGEKIPGLRKSKWEGQSKYKSDESILGCAQAGNDSDQLFLIIVNAEQAEPLPVTATARR